MGQAAHRAEYGTISRMAKDTGLLTIEHRGEVVEIFPGTNIPNARVGDYVVARFGQGVLILNADDAESLSIAIMRAERTPKKKRIRTPKPKAEQS